MPNLTIDDLRKAIDSLFAGETAEDVSHCILNALQIERILKDMHNENSAKRVLLALCRQYGAQVEEAELFRIRVENE